jgi:probable rRNA maturation factor
MRPNLRRLAVALARVSGRRAGRAPRAEILLTTDAHIAELAGRYRGSPHPTDVLAFPSGGEAGFAGEIAISLDTARRQAKARGVRVEEELLLLSVHGLWHLAGQGDETRRDWCGMRVREFEALARVL